MPISVVCPQGHKLKAKEKLAGKRLKCPKCGSVVQIPELESSGPDDELVSHESTEQPDPKMDLPADGETNNASEDDPLGLGDASSQSDPLFDNDLPPLDDPLDAQAELPTTANAAKTEEDSSSKRNMTLILAIAGGGAVLGLLLVGLLAWLLFGGSEEEPPAVAGNDVPPTDVAQAPPSPESPPSSEEPEQKPAEPPPTEPGPQPTKPEPTPSAPKPQPFELTPIDVDQRLEGFKLPDTTWAAAYDEVTGRLAITNDEAGILVYDLDDVLDGKLAPVATLPTAGLPAAVCLKPLPERRSFVFAGEDKAELLLVDADTLQASGQIALEDLKYVDYLTGSPNTDDPFVYYSTQRFLPGDRDIATGEVLGRVNLLTGEQDSHTRRKFIDITVSADGSRLCARPLDTSVGLAGAWSDIFSFVGDPNRSNIGYSAYNRSKCPLYPLGNVVIGENAVFSPTMNVFQASLNYTPGAAFRHRPVLVGLSKGVLVFGSANDYRRLASIRLPMHWLPPDRVVPSGDFRFRPNLSPYVRSAFLDTRADSTREMAVLTFNEHLLVAPLDRAELPAEPALFVRTSLPDKVAPGQLVQVKLELETETEDVVFEYVPHTDWLPNERQPLLGIMPPGEPSPRPLELRFGASAEQSHVILKNYDALDGRKLPIRLRIGNEVMLITKYEPTKMIVQRTQAVAHGDYERVAVVDELGRDLTTPRTPPKPKGKTLTLAASVNNQQTIIFVNDLGPLSDEELPLDIQIGDEKMVITSVDDFKTALNVERTEPVNHSVTSEILVLNEAALAEPPPPNLPTVEGRTFRWTPAADQLGRHIIRMRARAGKVTHEWFWETTVEHAQNR